MKIIQKGGEIIKILLQICLGFYVIAIGVVLPFYYDTATGYQYIGSGKSEFFLKWGLGAARVFLVVLFLYIIARLVVWLWENGKTKGKLSLLINTFLESLSFTDKFAVFYAVILWLSYYYSDYANVAKLGTNGWFMGMIPQLVFLGSYFALSRFFHKKMAGVAAGLMLTTAFFVFLLGILNRYQLDVLHMEPGTSGFISTIGNINWFCGYWSVLFPLGCGWFLFRSGEKKWWEKLITVLLGIFSMTGLAAGVTQGSDSGLLALVGLVVLAGCLTAGNEKARRRFWALLLLFDGALMILHVVERMFPGRYEYITVTYRVLVQSSLSFILLPVMLLILFLFTKTRVYKVTWWGLMGVGTVAFLAVILMILWNTLNPGSLGSLSTNQLFTFDADWGSSRGATWSVGVQLWLSQNMLHKIVGIGPDCMAAYIYSGTNESLLEAVRASFGDNRLTNAHGEWITILANVGIFGLIGFAGMIVSAVVRFCRQRKNALCIACGFSIFAYTVNNSFSFEQIMNITQMFMVLGLGECLLKYEGEENNG